MFGRANRFRDCEFHARWRETVLNLLALLILLSLCIVWPDGWV